MNITRDTILGVMLAEHPQAEAVLRKYLGESTCFSCPGKMYETIANGAQVHGLNNEQIDELVAALQQTVKSAVK